MNLDGLIEFVEKFILDIIGVVLPGLIFMLGIRYFLVEGSQSSTHLAQLFQSVAENWIVTIAVCYVCGHALHVFGDKLLNPVAAAIGHGFLGVRNSEQTVELAKKNFNYLAFISCCKAKFSSNPSISQINQDADFHAMRSLALSIATEALTYKFMFVSLMNLGVASAVFLIGLIYAFTMFCVSDTLTWCWIVFVLTVVIPYVFLIKYNEFHLRAQSVPFGVAVVKLLGNVESGNKHGDAARGGGSE